MNGRQHRFSPRGEVTALVSCVGLSLLLLFLPGDARVLVADSLSVVLTDPWMRVRSFAGDVVTLRGENAELQQRVAELELQASAADRELSDAARLAGPALDAGYTGELVPCRVVMRQRGRQVTMIKIASAQPVGWRVYQPVVSRAGYLGRVRQIVSAREAWVELLTAPDFALGVEIERTGLVGILRPHASTIRVDMIGRDEDVAPGDLVITSGITEVRDMAGTPDAGQTPRGFPLGVVATVEKPADGMFKDITIDLAASADVNETVFVVTSLGAGMGLTP
ncbi:MAG: rod shape-determining protein MreC [bacterium]|jgi:rod shape-determining protein MreC|nr:rod shape-determining protein MreC [bacterium]MBK7046241.1 rod shape-determining protein MreC [bacterium]MBK7670662.1 rod shape-determining protein MreC [bacterium]MBK7771281.1 rod shape-determining protein MreC [bacterium]MBK9473107.1 rod shape-determining protein MreC [bacterium]